ncbi:MAG TPA: GNAT family N-acetyltransferase [Caldimonas sp.]|nr:GNAT family N-acetyltransferase [Caldimonas sp.]
MSRLASCALATAPPAAIASSAARYPTELIDVWLSLDGERMTLRPILAQDEPGLRALFRRSSTAARDVIDNFPEVLEGICDIDFACQVAVVITVDRGGSQRIVAEARYLVADSGASADLAVLVEKAWQRQGLGRRALGALAEAARRSGLQSLRSTVRRTNAPMLLLLHRCGFCAATSGPAATTELVTMARDVDVVGCAK